MEIFPPFGKHPTNWLRTLITNKTILVVMFPSSNHRRLEYFAATTSTTVGLIGHMLVVARFANRLVIENVKIVERSFTKKTTKTLVVILFAVGKSGNVVDGLQTSKTKQLAFSLGLMVNRWRVKL